MKHHIAVLGTGMVGRAIVYDLSQKHRITAADNNPEALKLCRDMKGVETHQADLADHKQVARIIKDADLVLSAVPGFLGYETVRTVITKGKPVVDISFMPEDFMELDALAREKGVTAIADCGVAPGMPNLILGHHSQQINIERFEYMVGGLPRERKFPFEYKAPFSPVDVLEEYTRPARVMENGEVAAREAMSEPELIYFEGLGHLEAFNTDGLRSLLQTMDHIPYMKEKTLRYPGHIRLIRALKASGFFSEQEVDTGRQKVRPLDVTNQVLMKDWQLDPGEREFTIMRINLEGGGRTITYDLLDEYDPATGLSSMARTTGFTATAAASMLLEGIFGKKGMFPPEQVGQSEKCFRYIMDYLEKRRVSYQLTQT
ncbi:MAG: saccharopine dehydrogenase NADP-binding domain-containing protein [Bacteroidales bacterium]|nr:saccharopine dehydrogenase NADP-binding domain-containing protein [Bacteroidales bacterium]